MKLILLKQANSVLNLAAKKKNQVNLFHLNLSKFFIQTYDWSGFVLTTEQNTKVQTENFDKIWLKFA